MVGCCRLVVGLVGSSGGLLAGFPLCRSGGLFVRRLSPRCLTRLLAFVHQIMMDVSPPPIDDRTDQSLASCRDLLNSFLASAILDASCIAVHQASRSELSRVRCAQPFGIYSAAFLGGDMDEVTFS